MLYTTRWHAEHFATIRNEIVNATALKPLQFTSDSTAVSLYATHVLCQDRAGSAPVNNSTRTK